MLLIHVANTYVLLYIDEFNSPGGIMYNLLLALRRPAGATAQVKTDE